MKKLLVLLLALVMCLAGLTACFTSEPPADDDGQGGEQIVYKLDKAVAYVRSLYIGEEVKEEGAETGIITKYADFKRVSSVNIAGVAYAVEWSVSETDTAKVKVVQGSGTTETVIDVNEKTQEDINFTLTATVKAGDGTSDTVTFNVLIPKYEVISYEEYRAKADAESATIEGIVVAMNSKSAGNKRNHLFLVDAQGKGGYYAYDMSDDPVKLGIEVGMTVAVSGEIDIYQGMYELKGATARIINSEKTAPAAIDVSAKFGAGENILEYVGSLVTVKGVEIGSQELGGTSEYLYFSLNGYESYIRTYVTDLPTSFELVKDENDALTCAAKAVIDGAHAEKFGWTANVTGVLIAYNGNPYLMPVGTDCFEYTEFVEKTPEVKINHELEALELAAKLSADKVIEVVAAGADYSEVVITWSSNSDYAVVAADGKSISFTIPASATTVTITATGTIGEVSVNKTFDIELVPNTLVLSEGVPYYFGYDENGTMKYLNGANAGGKDYRWDLTDDAALAAQYFVEIAGDGEYYIYYIGESGKTYLNIVENGSYVNLLAGTEGVSKWSWNAELSTLAVTIGDKVYVPKSYNNYGNVEAKTSDYTYGDTYVLGLSAYAFNFGYDENGTMKYLNGENAGGKEYRWDLTDDAALAAKFYVEAAEGGYYIYFIKDGQKTYLNIVENGSYVNLLAGTEGISAWVYNEELEAFAVTLGDKIYAAKSYNNYGNVEAKTSDYTYGDTYCLSLFALGYAPEAGDDNTGSEGGETPDQPGEGGGETPEEPGTGEGGETPEEPSDSSEIVLTVDSLGIASQSYADSTATVSGVTFEFIQIGNYGNGLQMRDKDGNTTMLWNTAAFGAGIKEIKLVFSANKSTYDNADAVIFTFGNEAKGAAYSTKLSTVAGTKEYTITPDAATYTFFYLEHDLGYTMYWDSITIVLADPAEGGEGGGETPDQPGEGGGETPVEPEGSGFTAPEGAITFDEDFESIVAQGIAKVDVKETPENVYAVVVEKGDKMLQMTKTVGGTGIQEIFVHNNTATEKYNFVEFETVVSYVPDAGSTTNFEVSLVAPNGDKALDTVITYSGGALAIYACGNNGTSAKTETKTFADIVPGTFFKVRIEVSMGDWVNYAKIWVNDTIICDQIMYYGIKDADGAYTDMPLDEIGAGYVLNYTGFKGVTLIDYSYFKASFVEGLTIEGDIEPERPFEPDPEIVDPELPLGAVNFENLPAMDYVIEATKNSAVIIGHVLQQNAQGGVYIEKDEATGETYVSMKKTGSTGSSSRQSWLVIQAATAPTGDKVVFETLIRHTPVQGSPYFRFYKGRTAANGSNGTVLSSNADRNVSFASTDGKMTFGGIDLGAAAGEWFTLRLVLSGANIDVYTTDESGEFVLRGTLTRSSWANLETCDSIVLMNDSTTYHTTDFGYVYFGGTPTYISKTIGFEDMAAQVIVSASSVNQTLSSTNTLGNTAQVFSQGNHDIAIVAAEDGNKYLSINKTVDGQQAWLNAYTGAENAEILSFESKFYFNVVTAGSGVYVRIYTGRTASGGTRITNDVLTAANGYVKFGGVATHLAVDTWGTIRLEMLKNEDGTFTRTFYVKNEGEAAITVGEVEYAVGEFVPYFSSSSFSSTDKWTSIADLNAVTFMNSTGRIGEMRFDDISIKTAVEAPVEPEVPADPENPGEGSGSTETPEGGSTEEPVVQGFYLVASLNGTDYYFTGAVNSGKGAVTTNVAEAAVIYGEAGSTEDAAHLYIMVDGAKKYLAITANSTSGFGLVDEAFDLYLYEGEGYTAIYDITTNRGFALYKGNDLRSYAVSSVNNFTGENAAFGLAIAGTESGENVEATN